MDLNVQDLRLELLLLGCSSVSAGISSLGTYYLVDKKKLRTDNNVAAADVAQRLVDSAEKIIEELKVQREEATTSLHDCEEKIKELTEKIETLEEKVKKCVEYNG